MAFSISAWSASGLAASMLVLAEWRGSFTCITKDTAPVLISIKLCVVDGFALTTQPGRLPDFRPNDDMDNAA
jgi:hypothetical protein